MKKLIVLMAMPMFFAACSDSASYGRKPEDKSGSPQGQKQENIVQGQSSQAPVANVVSAQIQKISLPKVYILSEENFTSDEKEMLGAVTEMTEALGGEVVTPYLLMDNGNLTLIYFEEQLKEYSRADLNLVNGFGSILECVGGLFKKQGEPTSKIKVYHDEKFKTRVFSESDKEVVLADEDGPTKFVRVKNEAEILNKVVSYKRMCNDDKVF